VSEPSCFHHLDDGGLLRQLAPGIVARIFPGVHAMLSVVTLTAAHGIAGALASERAVGRVPGGLVGADPGRRRAPRKGR